MTPKQRARMKAAGIQGRLAEIEATETMTAALEKEQASLLATLAMLTPLVNAPDAGIEDLPGADGDEFRAILAGGSIGAIVDSAIAGRQPDGREGEIQAHFKLPANAFPIQMLRDPGYMAAVTPAPSDTGWNLQRIVPAVFPESVVGFLQIPTPTVPVGESEYAVLTTGASVSTPAEAAAAAESTGAFSTYTMKGRRYQASFRWSREDASAFAGMEEALRSNLSDAMSAELDKQALVNDDKGLLHGTVLADNDASATTTYANYVSSLGYGRVDGQYASSVRDIRVLMGGSSYSHAAMQYRANESDRSALDRLMADTAGVRVSAHVPGAVGNKQEVLVRRGGRMDAVMPLWTAVTMIPDSITKADEGEIRLTAVGLFNFALLRASGFHKQEVQHA